MLLNRVYSVARGREMHCIKEIQIEPWNITRQCKESVMYQIRLTEQGREPTEIENS